MIVFFRSVAPSLGGGWGNGGKAEKRAGYPIPNGLPSLSMHQVRSINHYLA